MNLSNFFVFCNEPIWLANHKKKLKQWRLPEIEDSKDGVPLPLAHLYRWEGEDFGQNIYGIKVRCYWEHPGNPLGTWRNMLGTKEKWKNSPSPPPPPSMRWLSILSRVFIFFPLGGEGRWFFNSCVPKCSQMFPNVKYVFPKGVPSSTSLYPFFFAQSSTLLTYIAGTRGRHSILA
jgi:hypothetical protein